MKKIAIIAAITSAFTVAGAQAAGNGTINFTGTVNTQTCNATIGSTASGSAATVTLPAAQANVLSSIGNTAGQTSFNISVTGCATTAPSGASNVKALFEKSVNVDSLGRLNNTATGAAAAQNVSLQLVDGVTNSPIVIGDASQNSGGYTNIISGAATLPYAVRYFATGVGTSGVVSASVNYTLIYN